MRKGFGKALFVIVLLCVFGALFMLCGNHETDAEMKAQQHNGNEKTYVKKRENDTVYIGGAGKVYRADIEQLYGDAGIDEKEISNLVVGDEPTEIGYGLYNGNKYVETVYLGENVSKVDHGAMMNCSSLKYIYVPSGLEKAGVDFLYNCPIALLVTDGGLEDLPEFVNVSPECIYTGISSHEALISALTPDDGVAFAADMSSDKPEEGEDPGILHPGASCSASDISLYAGSYTLTLTGQGLDKAAESDVRLCLGQTPTEMRSINIEENCVTCVFELEAYRNDIGFTLLNQSDTDLSVDRLTIHVDEIKLPAAVEAWWN